MLSVFRAAEPLGEQGIPYEILVHIDNGDAATSGYFDRYVNDSRVQIFHNQFGDLGLSRNFLAANAKGRYLSFLDADDLISQNWLLRGLDLLDTASEDTIVHPAAILSFYHSSGASPVLWLQQPSFDLQLDAKILLGNNRWAAVYIAPSETVRRFPYQPTANGIGYEDWSFNSATVAARIRHAIAPETVMFYRKREASLLVQSGTQRVMQPYCDLFKVLHADGGQDTHPGSLDPVLPAAPAIPLRVRVTSAARRFVSDKPLLRRAVRRPYEALVRKRRIAQLEERVPRYVVDAWADMNSIERQLYPTLGTLFDTIRYDPDNTVLGDRYQHLVACVATLPDYVFFVPWIVPGGADQWLLNYVAAIQEIHPDWNLAVIGTLSAENPWRKKLPANVPFLDFGKAAVGLDDYQRDLLMSRLIVQLGAKRLHIINSEVAYSWANRHQTFLISHGYTVDVSVFCYTVISGTDGKGKSGFDDPLLRDIYPVVNNVFTDNAAFINDLIELDGLEPSRCKVHYTPADLEHLVPPKTIDPTKPIRILWASRITAQKCPDILMAVADRLDPAKYHISVFGYPEPDFNMKDLGDAKSITFEGNYSGSRSLPTDSHDIFLYTSSTDGLPITLLDIAALGLPIVASSSGGVGEFIVNNETGLLIDPFDDVDAYVQAIEYLAGNPDAARQLALNAQSRLVERHGWDGFVRAVRGDLEG